LKEPNLRVQSCLPKGNAQAAYSLQVENPRIKSTIIETYPSMLAVVARAAELIRAGNKIGIWAPISPKKH